MAKIRSKFDFNFNCEPNVIDDLIQNYIKNNGGKIINKKGEEYYLLQISYLVPYFKYSINEQTLTIYAWFGGAFGEEIPVEKNKSNIYSGLYLDSLAELFREVEKFCNIENNTTTDNNKENNNISEKLNIDQNTNLNSNNSGKIQSSSSKQSSNLCELGFWLSIISLVSSLFGYSFNFIIYIFLFVLAGQGLNSTKKKKAIISIIILIISLVLSLIFKEGIIEAILF